MLELECMSELASVHWGWVLGDWPILQTDNSPSEQKQNSNIHTIVWIYASREEHKNRITNSEEWVEEKEYT